MFKIRDLIHSTLIFFTNTGNTEQLNKVVMRMYNDFWTFQNNLYNIKIL